MRDRGGFTLVEFLVVLAIAAILGSILLPTLRVAHDRSQVQKCKAEIQTIKSALEQYCDDFGDYPPSTLTQLGMKDFVQKNEGNKAMTACLATIKKNAPYLRIYGTSDRRFKNKDEDVLVYVVPPQPPPTPTETIWVFPDGQLRQFLDPWQNPYVYFHGRDLKDGVTATYWLRNRDVTGVSPAKDLSSGTYYSATKYQLWSVGPDGINGKNDAGECDDITSWATQ